MPSHDGSTLITPFADLLNEQTIITYRPATLFELDALIGMETGSLACVLDGGAIFRYLPGGWQQVTAATFPTTAARDAAYAQVGGAYRGVFAIARVSTDEYRHNGTAWVPNRPFAEASGVYTPTAPAGGNSPPFFWSSGEDLPLPAGRFTVAPVVTLGATAGSFVAGAVVVAVATTTVTFRLWRIGVAPTAFPIHWRAVQMLSTSATG